MNGGPGDPGTAAHRWENDSTGAGHVSADDPRSDERQRRIPDPHLDRILRHLLPADDDLPLGQAIRHHRELQEHAAQPPREAGHG